jgi:hypothetical protein
MWHNGQVTSEQSATLLAAHRHAESVAKAVHALQAAETKTDTARAKLFTEIAAARKAGVRPVDLAKLTGYSTEHIRQIIIKAASEQDPTP